MLNVLEFMGQPSRSMDDLIQAHLTPVELNKVKYEEVLKKKFDTENAE